MKIPPHQHWDVSQDQALILQRLLGPYLGYFALGTYVLVGGVLLKYLGSLSWQKAFQATGIFLTYRIVVGLMIAFLFS